jgi:hypothetical protein
VKKAGSGLKSAASGEYAVKTSVTPTAIETTTERRTEDRPDSEPDWFDASRSMRRRFHAAPKRTERTRRMQRPIN